MKKTIEGKNFKRFDINSFRMRDIKVLIIDIDEVNNNILLKMLNSIGIGGVIAHDMQSVKMEILKNEYDIIFIGDIFEENYLYNKGLNNKDFRSLIIGIDNNPSENFRTIIKKLGGELFLIKPLKLEQLAVIFRNDFFDKVV